MGSDYVLSPNLHRSARHESAESESMNEHSTETFVFEMGPGDVLYVPPFWFHRVVTNDAATVSLNLWWPSDLQMAAQRIWSVLIPIETEWSVLRQFTESMYFVHRLTHQWCQYVGNSDEKRSFCNRNDSAVGPTF